MYSESREDARDFARVRNACFDQVSILFGVHMLGCIDMYLCFYNYTSIHTTCSHCMPYVDICSKRNIVTKPLREP